MTPRVFIPQVPSKFDHEKDRFVPTFDLRQAAVYGQLCPILDDNEDPLYLARHTKKIIDQLIDFDENDFLLAVGDPSLIAVCAGVILRGQDTMKMLKWNRTMKTYITLEISL